MKFVVCRLLLFLVPLIVGFQICAEERSLKDQGCQVMRVRKNISGKVDISEHSDTVYELVVYVRPTFPGGDQKMMEWISQHIQYPQNALDSHIEGSVIVKFLVKEDGTIGDIQILKSVCSALDDEALRVVSTLPKFNPAEVNGKAFEYWFTVPITFRLHEEIECTASNEYDQSEVSHWTYDVGPEFPGGIENLMRFLAINLRLPKDWPGGACIVGNVIAKLEINSNGEIIKADIINASLPKEVTESAKEEAKRVIKLFPNFVPAIKNGEPVESYYIFPISFNISDYVKILNEGN